MPGLNNNFSRRCGGSAGGGLFTLSHCLPPTTFDMVDTNFSVFVRNRRRGDPGIWEEGPGEIVLKPGPKRFQFTRVFGPTSTQQDVYDRCAEPCVEEFLAGANATVFVYGQTGTGKTHTMIGDCTPLGDLSFNASAEYSFETRSLSPEAGIVPRVLTSVCSRLARQRTANWVLEMTFIELYNEQLRDLFDDAPPGTGKRPRILEVPRRGLPSGIQIKDAQSKVISSAKEGLHYIAAGLRRRETAATRLNDTSSRSHTILTLKLVNNHVCSKINLVDLAGSENVKESGATNARAQEASMINKSLLALGQVIAKLERNDPGHIPYRDSKLTRLLRDSLGGSTKTVMIATTNLGSGLTGAAVNTLEYAMRAKSIKNSVQTELEVLDEPTCLGDYRERLVRMQEMLANQQRRDGVNLPKRDFDKLNESYNRLQALETCDQTRRKENEGLRRELDKEQALNELHEREIAELRANLVALEQEKTQSRTNMANSESLRRTVDLLGQELPAFAAQALETQEAHLKTTLDALAEINAVLADTSSVSWLTNDLVPLIVEQSRNDLNMGFNDAEKMVRECAQRAWAHGVADVRACLDRHLLGPTRQQINDISKWAHEIAAASTQAATEIRLCLNQGHIAHTHGERLREQHAQATKLLRQLQEVVSESTDTVSDMVGAQSTANSKLAPVADQLTAMESQFANLNPLVQTAHSKMSRVITMPELNWTDVRSAWEPNAEQITHKLEQHIGATTQTFMHDHLDTRTAAAQQALDSFESVLEQAFADMAIRQRSIKEFEGTVVPMVNSLRKLSQPLPPLPPPVKLVPYGSPSRGSPMRSPLRSPNRSPLKGLLRSPIREGPNDAPGSPTRRPHSSSRGPVFALPSANSTISSVRMPLTTQPPAQPRHLSRVVKRPAAARPGQSRVLTRSMPHLMPHRPNNSRS